MAVHATRGQQAQDVYRPPRGNRLVSALFQSVGLVVFSCLLGPREPGGIFEFVRPTTVWWLDVTIQKG